MKKKRKKLQAPKKKSSAFNTDSSAYAKNAKSKKTKLPLANIRPKVAIIMGSLTDYESLKEAESLFKFFSVPVHTEVVSAHRTPDKMYEFAKTAKSQGFEVIIAAAGGAAHLPGMVASLTTLPVIGVPITVGGLKGLDALLSIVQMPKGVPVATVAIDNSFNAALLAIRILSVNDKHIDRKLVEYQDSQKIKVKEMNQKLRK